MAARAYWQGQIRLALVSIPVEIYSATKSGASVAFHQIHEPSGKRVKYEKVVPGIGPVDPDEIVKGFEYEKGNYVLLEPEEIDAVKLESKKTIDLVKFVDADEIDPRYFERPYYIVPTDEHAVEGYLVIRDALKKSGKLGVGQVTMSGREYLVAIGPVANGLGMHIMRYANEVRAAGQYFGDLPHEKLDPEMVSLATELIGRKAGSFTPEKFKNHYTTALQDLIKLKAKGDKIVAAKDDRPSGPNVVDLMDALRQSVKGGQPAKAPAAKAKNGSEKSAAKKKAGGGRR